MNERKYQLFCTGEKYEHPSSTLKTCFGALWRLTSQLKLFFVNILALIRKYHFRYHPPCGSNLKKKEGVRYEAVSENIQKQFSASRNKRVSRVISHYPKIYLLCFFDKSYLRCRTMTAYYFCPKTL